MPFFLHIWTFAGSEKVLENFSWGSWKVLEKYWIFLSVKEWEPWVGHLLLLLCIIISTVLGTVCHIRNCLSCVEWRNTRYCCCISSAVPYWELFVMYRVAGHPLAQNERCLHMFLLEPTIDKDYVPGKVRTTWTTSLVHQPVTRRMLPT